MYSNLVENSLFNYIYYEFSCLTFINELLYEFIFLISARVLSLKPKKLGWLLSTHVHLVIINYPISILSTSKKCLKT